MGLWITSVSIGLAFALLGWSAYLTFRVLRFPDISVDGTFTCGAAVTVVLITNGTNPLLATLAGMAAGAIGGFFTGIFHAWFRINELLSGVITMTALYSINLRIMGRSNVPVPMDAELFGFLMRMGLSEDLAWLVGTGGLVLLLSGGLIWFLRSDYGLALRATGDSPAMAIANGVDTRGAKIVALMLGNALAALAGSVFAQNQGFADITMGIGSLVIAIAALILGERLLAPKSVPRAVLGAVLGSVAFRVVLAVALLMKLNPVDMKLATAVLVLAALLFPQWRARNRPAVAAIAKGAP